ncbi:flagellar motor protein [Oleiphilus messinensis]|uniref:Flagellar motor protein n=1 Tax=Oleiphilus messinensis TaxID=141451 RepID=A0A1Y0I8T3_9GAMM|nr:flagellar motor protein MotB [Oleiphilus messinensis]ARU55895.1 flagellar motor protein [Oleiphilus messinensis]
MDDRAPIIIKRVKKYNKGHGGAWKVAFADFATAMMAFFLVLWLTATTTPEQREAIEGYFQDPIGFTEGGSPNPIDLEGSASIVDSSSNDQAPEEISFEEEVIEEMADTIEQRKLAQLMTEIEQQIEENQKLKEFKDQLLLDITDEGLRIQIVDKSKRPMFDSGKSELKYYSEDLLFELAPTIGGVPNKISLTGHTDAQPFAIGDSYSNWELSADRANAARRALVGGGVHESQISRVVGLGSSVLFDEGHPEAPINRRIAIIILNKKSEYQIQKNAGVQNERAKSPNPGRTPSESAREKVPLEKIIDEGSWFDDVEEVKPDEVTW